MRIDDGERSVLKRLEMTSRLGVYKGPEAFVGDGLPAANLGVGGRLDGPFTFCHDNEFKLNKGKNFLQFDFSLFVFFLLYSDWSVILLKILSSQPYDRI